MKNFIKVSLTAYLLVFFFISCEKEADLIVTNLNDNSKSAEESEEPKNEESMSVDKLIITSQWYTDTYPIEGPDLRVTNYINNNTLNVYLMKETYNGFRTPTNFTLESQVNSSGHTQYRFIAEFLAPGSDTFWTNGISE